MGADEGNMCFRIGLRTKGCNGMAYTLEYAEPDSKLKFEEQVNSYWPWPKIEFYFLGHSRGCLDHNWYESANDTSWNWNGL